jgi:hypothetical protein
VAQKQKPDSGLCLFLREPPEGGADPGTRFPVAPTRSRKGAGDPTDGSFGQVLQQETDKGIPENPPQAQVPDVGAVHPVAMLEVKVFAGKMKIKFVWVHLQSRDIRKGAAQMEIVIAFDPVQGASPVGHLPERRDELRKVATEKRMFPHPKIKNVTPQDQGVSRLESGLKKTQEGPVGRVFAVQDVNVGDENNGHS